MMGKNSVKVSLLVRDSLLVGEGWVPRVDAVTLNAASVGKFTEPEREAKTGKLGRRGPGPEQVMESKLKVEA